MTLPRHTSIAQPDTFTRGTTGPSWAWFPNLKLIFGWGDGLRETLKDNLLGVQHVFMLPDHPTKPSIAGFLDNRERRHDYSRGRDLAPPIIIEATSGASAVRYRLGDKCTLASVPMVCPGGIHTLMRDQEYAVRHIAISTTETKLALCRRRRTLKPQFQGTMKQCGLVYQPSAGRDNTLAAGSKRTPQEKQFADWMKKFKAMQFKKFLDQLKDPSKRPLDFEQLKGVHARSRAGAVQRGKKDAQGKNVRFYSEDDLVRLASREVAGRMVAQLIFDQQWEEVALYTASGGFSPIGA